MNTTTTMRILFCSALWAAVNATSSPAEAQKTTSAGENKPAADSKSPPLKAEGDKGEKNSKHKPGEKTPKNPGTNNAGSKQRDVKQSIAEWDRLEAQRRKIGKELRALKTEFSISSRKRKLEIKQEFESKVKQWNEEIAPRMRALAFVKLEHDPENRVALSFVEDSHDYDRVAALLERLIKAGRETKRLLGLAVQVNFSINNFKRALELAERAEKEGAYHPLKTDVIKEHIEYWKGEQTIRRKEAAAPKDQQLPRVNIETDKGDIIVELFENEAPNTVANFISLVEKDFYDGQHVHRVAPHFVVQAGDPNTKGEFDPDRRYGQGGPGYTIKCECYREDARRHFRGSLSMAHAGKDTGGSQFFITLQPTPHLNPHADNKSVHTVFGRVVEGMDVVEQLEVGDKIIEMTVLFKRDHAYDPVTSLDKDKPKPKQPVEARKPKNKPKPKNKTAKPEKPPKGDKPDQ